MTLANLHPWNRSKIDQIMRLLLCNEQHLTHFGISSIFSPLVEDLKALERDGIELECKTLLPVRLIMICGDNLGSHWLGGFTQNFSSAPYTCRYCSITQDEFHAGPSMLGLKRTPGSYRQALSELQGVVEITLGALNLTPHLINSAIFMYACQDYRHV